MVEQVEFANVIILNKVDLVTKELIETTKRLVKWLNPKARVMEGSFGKVDLLNIVNTNLFDMQEASESPGWLVSLKDGLDVSHGEADEYGVSSLIIVRENLFIHIDFIRFSSHYFVSLKSGHLLDERLKMELMPKKRSV